MYLNALIWSVKIGSSDVEISIFDFSQFVVVDSMKNGLLFQMFTVNNLIFYEGMYKSQRQFDLAYY